MHTLPLYPQPVEVEIELTNFCNATCVACPRHEITAPNNYMNDEVFNTILSKYKEYKKTLKINMIENAANYPYLTFAGMGDPLLHPKVYSRIKQAKDSGFNVCVITNGTMLNAKNIDLLVNTGVDEVLVSVWGIEEDEYQRSMGLKNIRRTVGNVEKLYPQLKEAGKKFQVVWVNSGYLNSSRDQIVDFWTKKGIPVEGEDIHAWNRAGYLKDELLFRNVHLRSIDFQKEIWCHQMYFTNVITHNGDAIICSNDFYKKTVVVGNILTDEVDTISANIHGVLARKQQNAICKLCKKSSHNYTYASFPWDAVLPEEEKRRYKYAE